MRYAIVLEKSKKNYSAYVPDIPGCIATGATAAEAVEQMRSALHLHLEGMREDGEPIPDPVTLVEYVDVQLPKRSAAAR
jgi:predicted RNase H-like HicB family nuclease